MLTYNKKSIELYKHYTGYRSPLEDEILTSRLAIKYDEYLKCIFDKSWDWLELSANPQISWEFIRDHPTFPWEFSFVSKNPNVTWEIICNNPQYKWNMRGFAVNPNLTWDILINNWSVFKNVIRTCVGNSSCVTPKIYNENKDMLIEFESFIIANPAFNYEDLLQFGTDAKIYYSYHNPNLTIEQLQQLGSLCICVAGIHNETDERLYMNESHRYHTIIKSMINPMHLEGHKYNARVLANANLSLEYLISKCFRLSFAAPNVWCIPLSRRNRRNRHSLIKYSIISQNKGRLDRRLMMRELCTIMEIFAIAEQTMRNNLRCVHYADVKIDF